MSRVLFLASVLTLAAFVFGVYVLDHSALDPALFVVFLNVLCVLFAAHLVAVFGWMIAPRPLEVRDV